VRDGQLTLYVFPFAGKMKIAFFVLLALLLALQYRLWVGEGSLAHIARLKQQIETQANENARLKMRNDQLVSEVDALRDGYSAIEAKAREDLGMIKEGETFFLFLEEQKEQFDK
jgi:cell division protein FtsB